MPRASAAACATRGGLLPGGLARPGMGERDPEGGWICGQPVGHGQRHEPSADREGVHGHLGPLDELLDDGDPAPGLGDRVLERTPQLSGLSNQGQPLLALPVRCLHDARDFGRLVRLGDDLPTRLRDPGLAQPLTLLELRRRQTGHDAGNRMREPLPLGNPRGDRHRPVDPRRDHAVDPLGLGEARDPRLVLRRDDRATVRVAKPGRRRIAIECDHEQVALSGRREQAELRGARA